MSSQPPTTTTTPMMTIMDAVRSRMSSRSFLRPPSADQDSQIDSLLSSLPQTPFPSTSTRFTFIRKELGFKASYGMISGSKWFGVFFFFPFSFFCSFSCNTKRWIVGIVKKGQNDLEALGFQLARVLIGCTRLGIGTIPLGGTFSLGSFESELSYSFDAQTEAIPIVVPVGIPDLTRSGIMGAVVKWIVDPRTRKDWASIFFDSKIGDPLSATTAGAYADALDAVRLAPSSANKQPWSVVRENAQPQPRFHFTSSNTTVHSRIDLGIAMGMFTLATEALGLNGSWQILPEAPASISLPVGTTYVSTWRMANLSNCYYWHSINDTDQPLEPAKSTQSVPGKCCSQLSLSSTVIILAFPLILMALIVL